MKFSTYAIIASSIALAAADCVEPPPVTSSSAPATSSSAPVASSKFAIQVSGGQTGWASPIHEGAGINFAQIGTSQPTPNFSLNGTVLAYYDGSSLTQAALIYTLSSGIPVLEAGILPDSTTGVFQTGYGVDSNNQITYSGNANGWYACNNIGDPYNYPSYFVAFYGTASPASSCSKITLTKV